MGWDEDFFALLDDLEGQAEALYDQARLPELVDRGHAEYAAVTLASRLMASVDRPVVVEVHGIGHLEATLARVSATWCLLTARGQDWIVPHSAVIGVVGASSRSLPEVAWSPITRLSFGGAIRRLAEAGERCVLHRRDATRLEATPRRVGQDFVEAVVGADRRVLVPFSGLVAVQRRA